MFLFLTPLPFSGVADRDMHQLHTAVVKAIRFVFTTRTPQDQQQGEVLVPKTAVRGIRAPTEVKGRDYVLYGDLVGAAVAAGSDLSTFRKKCWGPRHFDGTQKWKIKFDAIWCFD